MSLAKPFHYAVGGDDYGWIFIELQCLNRLLAEGQSAAPPVADLPPTPAFHKSADVVTDPKSASVRKRRDDYVRQDDKLRRALNALHPLANDLRPRPTNPTALARALARLPKAEPHVREIGSTRKMREIFSDRNRRVNTLAKTDAALVRWWGRFRSGE
jgi:hypothetical protein